MLCTISGAAWSSAQPRISVEMTTERNVHFLTRVAFNLQRCFQGCRPTARAATTTNSTLGAARFFTLDARNIVNRFFKPLLKCVCLHDIRWHDLRHTCFTLLLARSTHPKYVQHLASGPTTATPPSSASAPRVARCCRSRSTSHTASATAPSAIPPATCCASASLAGSEHWSREPGATLPAN